MKTFLYSLMLLATTSYCQVAPSVTTPRPHGSSKDPALAATIKKINELRRQGALAEAGGKYADAERWYLEFVREVPHAPVGYMLLARLYDRMGRDRDAYLAYRRALAPYEPYASSIRYSGPLARYGDLAARFGTIKEARDAYALASAVSDRDDVWDPRPVPRSDSLSALKSAAHTAAGIVALWGGGGYESGPAIAQRELNAAIAADPGYWVPYHYRAFLDRDLNLPKAEEIRDMATAERLGSVFKST